MGIENGQHAHFRAAMICENCEGCHRENLRPLYYGVCPDCSDDGMVDTYVTLSDLETGESWTWLDPRDQIPAIAALVDDYGIDALREARGQLAEYDASHPMLGLMDAVLGAEGNHAGQAAE